jgi:ATP-binding cassette subfamily C protein
LIRLFRRARFLVDADKRGRWVALMILAAVQSLTEALGAVLVFALVGLIATPSAGLDLPVIGQLEPARFGLDEHGLLLAFGGFVAVFFLLRAGLVVVQSYLQNRVAWSAGARLSARLLEGYLSMPFAYHLRRNSAEIIRNSSDTVTQVIASVWVPGVTLASESFVIIALLAVMVTASPLAVGLAALLFAPLLLVVAKVIQPRLALLGRRSQAATATGYQWLQQSLGGLRDVLVFGREEFFTRSFTASRAELSRTMFLRNVLVDIPRVALETVAVLLIVAFLAVSVLSDSTVQSTLPVLGLFGYAMLRLMPSLNRVVMYVNHLRFGSAAVDILYDELVELESASRPRETGLEPLPFAREIKLEGVSFEYDAGAAAVLCDVNLSIRKGESVGIVGPTGGGKTTLIDVIAGLLRPSEGRVLVDGVDVSMAASRWQRQLGVVPQTLFLLDDTLRRNIAFGLDEQDIDDGAVAAAARMAQLEEFVAALPEGLETVVGERGVRLSGGQRQRVAIARALYSNPEVLIFDEGTSALDTATEEEVVRALGQLRGQRTMITVAHRLTTVRECHRILLMESGRLVDAGTYEQVRARDAKLSGQT